MSANARRRKMPLLLLGGVLCVLAGIAFSRSGLFITDNGAKYIILRSVAEHGTAVLRSEPGEKIDADGEFYPGGFHFRKIGDENFSFHAPYFSMLAAPLWRLAGDRSLPFWSFAGSALAALAALVLARRLRVGSGVGGAAVLLLATPLLFYTFTFWEMTLACAVGGAAFWLMLGAERTGSARRYAACGVLLGAGLFLREEFYLLALAIGVCVLWAHAREFRRWGALAGGGAAAAGLYWLCNFAIYGNVLGLHGAAYHSNNATVFSAWRLLENYWVFLFRFDGFPRIDKLLPLLLCVIVLLGASARGYAVLRRTRTVLCAIAAALWGVALCFLETSASPVTDLLYTISLVTGNPIFLFFFANSRALCGSGRAGVRLTARSCAFFCLLAPLLLSQNDMGIVWGARHFMTLFAPLVVLSLYAARRMAWRRGSRWLLFLLLLASLCLQLHGVRVQGWMSHRLEMLNAAVEKRTDRVIVSDLFFLPELTPARFFDRTFLAPHRDGDLLRIGARLREKKIERFSVLLSLQPSYRKISDAELKRFLDGCEVSREMELLRDRTTAFLDCLVLRCKLK